jgi:cation transporter-like permease
MPTSSSLFLSDLKIVKETCSSLPASTATGVAQGLILRRMRSNDIKYMSYIVTGTFEDYWTLGDTGY